MNRMEEVLLFDGRSPGKLLLSGEYFVLQGGLAFGVPLKFGTRLEVFSGRENDVYTWETLLGSSVWFRARFHRRDFSIIEPERDKRAIFISRILAAIREIGQDTELPSSLHFVSTLGFRPEWGWGSSASLIVNMAAWAGLNPFLLHAKVSRGSGYDIACAYFGRPLLFRKGEKVEKPFVQEISIAYPFSSSLSFLFLGQKQDSEESVFEYLDRGFTQPGELEQISLISMQLAQANSFYSFQQLLVNSVEITAHSLGIQPPFSDIFRDFPGIVKPLGAWGGDFCLVASSLNFEAVSDFFSERGFKVLFRWDDLVTNSPSFESEVLVGNLMAGDGILPDFSLTER